MEKAERTPCIKHNPVYASNFKSEFFGGKAELKFEGDHYYWVISLKDGRKKKIEINDNCICLDAEVLGLSYDDECPLLFLGKDKETGKNFIHYVIYSSTKDKILFDHRYDISNDDVYVLASSMIGFYEENGMDRILFKKRNRGVYSENLIERNQNQDFRIEKVEFNHRKNEPEIKIGFNHYGVNYVAILQFACNRDLLLSAIMDENGRMIYTPEDKHRYGREIGNFYYLKGILAAEIMKHKKKNESGVFGFTILDQEHSYLDGKYKYNANVHGYIDTKTGAMVLDDMEDRYHQLNDSLEHMFNYIKRALAGGKLSIDGYEESLTGQSLPNNTANDGQILLNMLMGMMGGNKSVISLMNNYTEFLKFFSYGSYQEAKESITAEMNLDANPGFRL